MTRPTIRLGLIAVSVTVAGLLLAGCTAQSTAPKAKPSDGGTPASTATATPGPAVFNPDGTAADNLPIFKKVVHDVWAGGDKLKGRAYIDALVTVGFADKTAMQLTPDETTIGDPVDTIQFSVLFKDQCLMGQVGPATGEPSAFVAPKLPNGKCMFGNTRPIDW